MNDLTPKSPQEIRKAGMVGIGAGVGGIALLVLSNLAGGIGGIIIGGIVALGGLAIMGDKNSVGERKDKTVGAVVAGTGALVAAAGVLHFIKIPVLYQLARFGTGVLGLGGLVLLGLGIYNVVKFVKGLKSRA